MEHERTHTLVYRDVDDTIRTRPMTRHEVENFVHDADRIIAREMGVDLEADDDD